MDDGLLTGICLGYALAWAIERYRLRGWPGMWIEDGWDEDRIRSQISWGIPAFIVAMISGWLGGWSLRFVIALGIVWGVNIATTLCTRRARRRTS
jgi:hypothetical protein